MSSEPANAPAALTPERSIRLLLAQTEMTRRIAAGAPLYEILDFIIRFMEEESGRAICSVLLLEEHGTRLAWGSAPSLPNAYNRFVDHMRVGPANGSCGTAIYRRRAVVVTDIAHDPLWAAAREEAAAHGLKACTSMPILNAAKEPLGTFAFYFREQTAPNDYEWLLLELARDLTGIAIERLLGQRALTEANEALRAALDSRDAFLTAAAHELRTPITALKLGLDAAVDGAILPLPILRKQADRLARLVQRFLEIGRLASGDAALHRERADLREIVDDVAQRLAPALAAAGAALETTGTHTEGYWDRRELAILVENLLQNAIRFGEGAPIRVTIAAPSTGWARLEVADRGPGIDTARVRRVFDRYATAVNPRQQAGLGVGLWLVHEIAVAHGGHVTVEAAPGGGTLVTIDLPQTQAAPSGGEQERLLRGLIDETAAARTVH